MRAGSTGRQTNCWRSLWIQSTWQVVLLSAMLVVFDV